MLLALAAAPLAARAQPAARPARIVFLLFGRRPPGPVPAITNRFLDAFKQGMRELGHVEGKTFVIEPRWSSNKVEDVAKEVAAFQPDVILTNEIVARVARQAAPAVPIVLDWGDPVAGGLAKSLAWPGGNVTGLATLNQDTSPKLLELLLAVVPKLSRVAVLANPNFPSYATGLKNLQNAGRQAGVELLPIEVRSVEEIDSGFAR
ncbi:MAG TPA: ABC transporter substrate binding protein, partial [Burkholderiales bacterium]|nr:ABC transporter substrate binding protein [Burkholderiales bacterium]